MGLSPLSMPSTAFGHAPASFQGQRRKPIHGVVLHTTGSGLPGKTKKTADATLRRAVKYYTDSGGPTYVIGWDGRIVSVAADESIRTWHVGVDNAQIRSKYRHGGWQREATPALLRQWRARWPGLSSPFEIIPGDDDGNSSYIGIEMIPVGTGGQTWAKPMRPGLRFTRAQHEAARKLVDDIGRRHGFPSGWKDPRAGRLVGHSDLNPLERQDQGGGWDPGYLRRRKYFDMDHVRGGDALRTVALVGLAGAALAGAATLLS